MNDFTNNVLTYTVYKITLVWNVLCTYTPRRTNRSATGQHYITKENNDIVVKYAFKSVEHKITKL